MHRAHGVWYVSVGSTGVCGVRVVVFTYTKKGKRAISSVFQMYESDRIDHYNLQDSWGPTGGPMRLI